MDKNFSLQDKIFIAGSTGMVGSSIVRNLKKAGYGSSNYGGKIFTPSRKELNLFNYHDVDQWFSKFKPNIVILAAAKVGGILANKSKPADFILENLKIQNNVIEISWKHKIKKFLFLGSSCIYPKYATQPIKEEYLLNGLLEETNEPYAIAKIAGIKLCEALRKQYDFNAISLMPTNLYGPKDNYDIKNSHVMASLIRKFYEASKNSKNKVICWGSGNPMREFMHVDDLSSAVIHILENKNKRLLDLNTNPLAKDTNIFNVGTGKDISIYDLAKKIAKKTKFEGEIIWDKSKPDGTPKKQLDISKIKGLGWSPKIDLDRGIESTIVDYANNN